MNIGRLTFFLVLISFCFTTCDIAQMPESKLECRAFDVKGAEYKRLNSGSDLLASTAYKLHEMGYNKQVNQDDALCVFAGDDTFDDSYGVILKGHQYYEDF